MTLIGIDTEEIARFRERDYDTHGRFYHRIFTDGELEYCSGRVDPYPHLAARFAAKEAVIKALWPRARLFPKQIEVLRGEDGVPGVRLHSGDDALANVTVRISMSHSDSQAVACALVEEGGA